MDKHIYSEIYDAGGRELLAFAKLLEHINSSCGVCMLEESGLASRCLILIELFDAWEITRLESLKAVLDVTSESV